MVNRGHMLQKRYGLAGLKRFGWQMNFARWIFIGLWLALGLPAWAQDRVWVQIEAQPSLAEAETRARAYAALFPDVAGYQLASDWYAVVLGPYGVAEGAAVLANLRRENLIPRDSFIADGSRFGQAFWPVGGVQGLTVPEVSTSPITVDPLLEPRAEPPVVEAPVVEAPAAPDETPDEALRSEATLPREDREALQTALQWFGFYQGGIDGAFGRGTRASMGAWQDANGYEATGILTTLQRSTLVGNWQADIAEFGFQTVTDAEAGIEITLPLSLVEFDTYEPPFARYTSVAGSDMQVYLISQPGDQAGLAALYDLLQTLQIMPVTGERERRERSFSISGQSESLNAFAYAEVSQGLVKGYLLTWNPAKGAQAERVLTTMQTSFRAYGDRALDPGMVAMDAGTKAGLLSGLEVRRPKLSRTGFFVDAGGTVLTTSEAVANCGRVTIERETDATVRLIDEALGIAVLAPQTPVAPPGVAGLQISADRVGAGIVVPGYPYEDRLSAPVLTYGAIAALEGLTGEADVKRLAITTQAGDAGGPVVDATGAVLGMLLTAAKNGAQVLPEDVAFAVKAAAITQRLAADGIILPPVAAQAALPPEDLALKASGMTVLVSCWE
jgi:Putative peptidoglycan binding domain/Trypsin-like peptidase domain/SPOR domain